MSSKPSKKQRKKQAAALAAASATFGSGLADEVPDRAARRNQAIGHGAITIQPDLLEMHTKKKKSSAALSRGSRSASKPSLKGSKNAPVATVLSKKPGIELVSSSVLLQVQLSNGTLKRIRFELKDTIAHCLKHVAKHDKDTTGSLFSTTGGIWLDGSRTIGSYYFEEMEVLDVRPQPDEGQLLHVRVMVPHDATLDTLSIDPKLATGKGILQSIENKPKTFDLASSAVFFQRGGVWLDNEAPVDNYDLKENDTLIYGERSKKKIVSQEERLKQEVPPLISTMSESLLLSSGEGRPSRASSSALARGNAMEMMRAMAVTRANSTEAKSLKESGGDSDPSSKKASFADTGDDSESSADDIEVKPMSIRSRRAMSLSVDSSQKLIPSFSRGGSKDSVVGDNTLNLSVLVASHQARVVIHVKGSDTVAHAEEEVVAEMAKQGSVVSDCHLFHPRNMTLMESHATLASYELKDEDLLVFKEDETEEKKGEERKAEKSGGKGKGFFHRIRTSSKKDSASPPASPPKSRPESPADEAGPLLLDHRIVKLYLRELAKQSAEKEEGIFRISGNAALVNDMRADIKQKGPEVSLEGIDSHELAGGLKYYFRDIEEPVVPYEFYDRFLETHSGSSVDHDRLKELISELPDEHRKTLAMTTSYLTRVTAEAESNLMSADNVGIVFGPTLIRNPGDAIDLAKTGALADIVAFILEHHDTIIDPADASFEESTTDILPETESGAASSNDDSSPAERAEPEVEAEQEGEGQAANEPEDGTDDEDDSYDESGASESTVQEPAQASSPSPASAPHAAAANLQLAQRDEDEDEDEEEENLEHESDEEGERDADVAALALAVAVAVQEQECPVAQFDDVTPRVEESIDAELDAVVFNLTVDPKEGANLLLRLIQDPERCMELASSKSKLDLINLLKTVAESLANS